MMERSAERVLRGMEEWVEGCVDEVGGGVGGRSGRKEWAVACEVAK